MPITTLQDYLSAIGVLVVFSCILFLSDVRLLVKIALLGVTAVITGCLLYRRLFSTTPIAFLSMLLLLFVPGGHPTAVALWICMLVFVAVLYMLALWVPGVFVASAMILVIVAGYIGLVTVAAQRFLDPPAFAVYIGVLYLLWYGLVHSAPLPRYRLT